MNHSDDQNRHLAIVTDVLKEPKLEIMDSAEMAVRFQFDVMSWTASPK
jgi:hypothetical protein